MKSGPEQFRDWMKRRGFTIDYEAGIYMGWDAKTTSELLSGKRKPGLAKAVDIERQTGIPVAAWVSSELDDSSDESVGHAEKSA